jgi:hypothetical protein
VLGPICRSLCRSVRTRSASTFASPRSDLARGWNGAPGRGPEPAVDGIYLTTGRQQRRYHQASVGLDPPAAAGSLSARAACSSSMPATLWLASHPGE